MLRSENTALTFPKKKPKSLRLKMTSKIIKFTLNPLVQSWNKLIFLLAKNCKCLDESTCDEVPTGPALIFGDGTSCRSREIRISNRLMSNRQLGEGLGFQEKRKDQFNSKSESLNCKQTFTGREKGASAAFFSSNKKFICRWQQRGWRASASSSPLSELCWQKFTFKDTD